MKAWRSGGGDGGRAAAGVVDQHVEAAEVAFDGVEQRLQRVAVTHVAGDEHRAAPVHAGQLLGCTARTDDDLRPGRQEALGNPGTDAFAAAGNEYHLATEIKPHCMLLVLLSGSTLGAMRGPYFV
ncbi:hypothetical protein D3C71_1718890 [compost metagenome]